MKKLLLVALSVISYCSYAEVNRELYNNYMVFYMPEVSPHSKPIKSQEITSNVTAIKKTNIFDMPELLTRFFYDDKIIIKSSLDNGFITYEESEKQIYNPNLITKLEIDYDKKKSLFWNDGKTSESKFTFNANNSILDKSSPKSQVKYIYDENNQIVNIIGTFVKFNINTKFIYTNDGLIKSSYTLSNDESHLSISTKEFIYDSNHRLAEIITTSYVSIQTSYIQHCYFSQYNEYGDWTAGQCNVSTNDVYVENIKRKLEY